MNLNKINRVLSQKDPKTIVEWALSKAEKPLITTNFRPYEVAILHLVTQVVPQIKVVWCDTGYNTPETYRHANMIINQLNLNIDTYVPKQSVAHRNITLGIPEADTADHRIFTEQVKLEPFTRAMAEHEPDVWFTNLRKGQTALRDSLDVISIDKRGILKVSPFYHYSDSDLDEYLKKSNLPNEHNYYDPTKQIANRECGLHV